MPGVALAIVAIAVLFFTRHRTFTPGGGREELEPLVLESSSIKEGRLPATFTCDGANVSPALAWGSVPEGTRSLALILSDRDSPEGTFVHWILFNLPPETRSLPEALGTAGQLPNGALEGHNDFGRTGYGGPCPPDHNPHRYQFYLFALDRSLDLRSGASVGQLEQAVQGHTLAHGTLTATYSH